MKSELTHSMSEEKEEGGIDSEPGILIKFASFRNKFQFPDLGG